MRSRRNPLLSAMLGCVALATAAQAQYLTNLFNTDLGTNNPPVDFQLNKQDPNSPGTNLVYFSGNGVVFDTLNNGARSYVATTLNDYNTRDFVATINFTNGATTFASFFGFGSGLPGTPAQFGEPVNSITMRARRTGGQPGIVTAPNVTAYSFTRWGSGVGTGLGTMRIQYSSTYNLIQFTLTANSLTETIGPVPVPASVNPYTIFFGSGNRDMYTNLVIKAPDVVMAATNFSYLNPPPVLYVGYPSPVQIVAAKFNTSDSAVNFSADINTVYSSENPAVCDVAAFGGALNPIADGVCNIIATNSVLGLTATQTVTVVSTPPDIYMTNTLLSTSIPTNMMVNLGGADNVMNFTQNGLVFTGTGNRSYLATAYNAYETQDFQFDVDCTTNVAFAGFFGIGRGTSTAVGNEPANSTYVRIRFSGAQPEIRNPNISFNAFPGGIGAGPIHCRILYTVASGQVSFRLSNATTNQTINVPIATVLASTGGGGVGNRLFIGGSGNTTAFNTFTNFVVKSPGIIVTNLYFGNTPFTNLFVGQPTTAPLQVLGNLADGSPQNLTLLSSYSVTNGSVVSVDPAGLMTVIGVGTDEVTATYTDANGTKTAKQAVRVLAPTAVRIDLPAVYEGTANVQAILRADFTATITNINVNTFSGVVGSWQSTNTAALMVDGNGLVTPVAPGETDLTANYDTLIATNHVTVLAPPPYYRTDSFKTGSLPSGYYVAKSDPGDVITFTPQGAQIGTTLTRQFIYSAINYYNASNFVADLWIRTNNPFAGMFGIGGPVPDTAWFGEPTRSLYIRARNTGGVPDVSYRQGNTAANTPYQTFTTWPGGIGSGPIKARIAYDAGADAISFTLWNGVTNQTIGPLTLSSFTGLTSGFSIFFGSGGDNNVYSDLRIQATAPTPAVPTLTQSVSGSSMTLTWSEGFLLRAPSATGSWTPVPGALSPYTFTVNPANAQEYFRVVNP